MIAQLSNQQIEAIKANNAYLLDVRTKDEFESEKSKFAINKDVHELAAGGTINLPKQIPIFIYCRSGARAELARHLLEKQGFTDVANIGGYHQLPLSLR